MSNKNPKPPIDRDDPRLTAYVLDEVTAEERATIEAALAADPSLAEEIESIRQTVGLLETTLAAEPLPEETVKVPTKKKWYQRRLPQLGMVAASACLLLALILPALQSARECARNTAPMYLTDSESYDVSGVLPSDESVAARPAKPLEGEELKYGNKNSGQKTPPSLSPEGKPTTLSNYAKTYDTAQSEMEPTHSAKPLDYRIASKKDQDASVPHDDKSSIAFPKKWDQLTQSRSQLRHEAIDKALKETEDSSVAFDDRQPIVYPSAEVWNKMSERRLQKMKPTNTAKDGSADKKPAVPASSAAPAAQEPPAFKPGMAGGMGMMAPVGERPSNLARSRRVGADYDKNVNESIDKEYQVFGRVEEKLAEKQEQYRVPPLELRVRTEPHNTEAYDEIVENEFLRTNEQPLSTFSIDVDTAGYSNLRRFLNNGSLPPKGSVRTEEMVNYFEYDYSPPTAEDKTPFAANMAVAACPWNEKHELVRIALKGRVVEEEKRPEMNLVFLLDVSGSMSDQNKLPLVKEGMTRLVRQLNGKDHVAIAVYAGASGLVLPSTAADEEGKPKILAALDRLQSGGSTNGGEGIRLAYATAAKHFNSKGVNRVILCTDGDFNVGTTSQSALISLIEKKAKEDVFLTVLGFGCGNYKDSTLEKLADKGNGNYGYIDNLAEAEKLLVRQLLGTLVTIAKDVKIQVEFNPTKVAAYRLLGYENRVMAKEDFNDDTKDAGEIGAGHTVTAFYELVPVGSDESVTRPAVDPLKYQSSKEPLAVQGEMGQNDGKPRRAVEGSKAETPESPTTGRGSLESGRGALSTELLTLKLRYKEPTGDTSTKVEFPLVAPKKLPAFAEADSDFRFAGSVVGFAMLLRDSKFKGTANFKDLIDWAENAQGSDPHGYRKEFIQLLRAARSLSNE